MARMILLAGCCFAALAALALEANAQLHVPKQTAAPGPAAAITTESAKAEIAGDHGKALGLAEQAIKADPNDPWGYYDKGMALAYAGRTDEAVAALREAERRWPTDDMWGKSVAIWGQANALNQTGRCAEAAPIYERYAVFVEKVDAEDAAMARSYAKHCTSRASGK